jgi:glycolate oxidase
MGIIYSARLSVLPLPTEHRTSLVAAGRDEEAMGIAAALLSTGFMPSVFEFIDSKTMACVSEYREITGLTGTSSYLFFEVDGSAEEVTGQQALLEEFCSDRALDLKTARNEQQRELLWELRRSVSPSLARRGVTKVNEDVALPLGRLVEAVPWIHGLASELELDCYIFGHCGDGNLHVNIMTDRRRSEEMQRVEQFVERLFRRVIEMGGTLSGEHGIGITKNRYLGLVFTPDEIILQNEIKRAIDERELMNPGKYFSGGGAGVHR